MRISDWSSDVCSSDLQHCLKVAIAVRIATIPAHRPQDHITLEMAPLEIRHRSVRPISAKHAQASRFLQQSPRDNDLRGAEVITDPKGDRKRRANEQDDPDLYVRIVERREDGIVVRGAKLHITAASLVHELVVMPTKGMRPEEADYAVSFSIPVKPPRPEQRRVGKEGG